MATATIEQATAVRKEAERHESHKERDRGLSLSMEVSIVID